MFKPLLPNYLTKNNFLLDDYYYYKKKKKEKESLLQRFFFFFKKNHSMKRDKSYTVAAISCQHENILLQFMYILQQFIYSSFENFTNIYSL